MANLSWPEACLSSNWFIYDGASMLEEWSAESSDYGMSLDIPSTMGLWEATELAAVTCNQIARLRSGIALLDFVENNVRRIVGEVAFAERWPDGFPMSLQPNSLQLLAGRLSAISTNCTRDAAATSLMVYALLGLASQVKSTPRNNCRWCYRTAVSRHKYCELHQAPRNDRARYTKRRGEPENLDVARRRAAAIRKLAIGLRLNREGLYSRLYRQLHGIEGGLAATPPPLEAVQDNEFAAGARVGSNGAAWFVYLWKVLPRTQKVLGPDWPELVRSALERNNWLRVFQRLASVDAHKQETDACSWALTLIEAEEWAEAEDLYQRYPRRRGRRRLNDLDPRVQYAKRRLNDGAPIAEVAVSFNRSTKTLYRWTASKTSH